MLSMRYSGFKFSQLEMSKSNEFVSQYFTY